MEKFYYHSAGVRIIKILNRFLNMGHFLEKFRASDDWYVENRFTHHRFILLDNFCIKVLNTNSHRPLLSNCSQKGLRSSYVFVSDFEDSFVRIPPMGFDWPPHLHIVISGIIRHNFQTEAYLRIFWYICRCSCLGNSNPGPFL